MRRLVFLLAWFFICPTLADAASFDCTKAATAVEKTICGDPTLSKADERLAEAYAAAAAASLAPHALQSDQNQWLGQRNQLASAGPLLQAYQARIDELAATADKWRKVPRQVGAESIAVTCLLPPDPPDGKCTVESSGNVGGALRYQIQDYHDGDFRSGGGAVVLRVAAGHLTPLLLAAEEGAHFSPPVLAQSGRLLVIPGHEEGTGNFNIEMVYLVDGTSEPRELDTESWLRDLQHRLPKGLGAWKGIYPDYDALTAETPLWKDGDGNCCATGGRAFIRLEITNRRLAIADLRIKLGEAAADGEK
jgi:uncharacterized protein YecT (DUF1311 family)